MQYDAIISLGSFCQVGGALWVYELKNVNSPLDNFGIKRWTSITEILKTRFKDYWRLENMGTGKVVEEFSAVKGGQAMIRKAYDNLYDLVSNHNFLEENNPDDNPLATYPEFREKLAFLEQVFLKQCSEYDNIRFILKAMSWPNPKDTPVEPKDVQELLEVLDDLRGGKAFDLSLSVPVKQYDKIATWVEKENIKNLRVSSWEVEFNNEKHHEWDLMFEDAELDNDYYWQLISRIIGNTEINLQEVNNF